MKKVLIISYYFSDLRDIAAVRINGLAKFLPKFGWKPYILTAKLSYMPIPIEEFEAFEAPCEDSIIKWKRMLNIKKYERLGEELNLSVHKTKRDHIHPIVKLWLEFFAYPDTVSHWRGKAVDLGGKLIAKEHFDAMISSSGPPTCNLIAKDLNEKYEIPWIADFRDLWTQNHYSQYSRFRRFFERRLEMKTLSRADTLTTVSQPLSEKLKELHPGKRVFSIPNGFDPDQRNPGVPLAKKFTITYTGALYQGRRNPDSFFQALSNLISNGLLNPDELSMNFYGPEESWLKDDVKKYGLNEVIRINGSISRDESIEKQRSSHLLLLLTWDNKEEKGIYTGKIFDYLAARRPILSIGASGGVIENLLKTTGAGFQPSSQEDIEKVIKNAYHEYKSRNTVDYHGLSSEIDKFSHIEMAKKFSTILNELGER
jgi:glycosyltransferase involved in cell wall biosynthesis